MNLLVIYEYRKQSANYNIALKIINELRNKGINVFEFYYYDNANDNSDKSNDDVIWGNTINSPQSRYYYNNNQSNWWKKRSKIRKLCNLILHPRFSFSFACHIADRFSNFYDGRKRIKRFCLFNNIDCILGFSAPHEIEKIMSRLKMNIPMYVFRLDPYAYNSRLAASEFNKRIKEEEVLLSRISMLFSTKLIIRDLIADNVTKVYSYKFCPVEFPLISDVDVFYDTNENSFCQINKSNGNIYLLHAGTFYEDIRNPNNLVKFIKELPDNFYLIVAGINSNSIRLYDSEVRNRILDFGCISREEVNSLVELCDFLISYNNLNTNMIPSKLFECIDSGKPFINLCQTDRCPTIDYVKDYDMAFSVFVDKPFPKEEIMSFFNRTKGLKNSRNNILSKYGNCTVKYVTRRIIDSINLNINENN